jgi:hypothetical protein
MRSYHDLRSAQVNTWLISSASCNYEVTGTGREGDKPGNSPHPGDFETMRIEMMKEIYEISKPKINNNHKILLLSRIFYGRRSQIL